jgi:Uma2 family endonuclease
MTIHASLAAPGETVTFEEYLTACDGATAEWVAGTVLPMSPTSDQHQDIVEFLAALMRYLAEETDAGIVRTSQIAMHIGETARLPDILFLSAEHLGRRHDTFIEGPADLVIEVVSPESRARDRGEKFYEYEQAGIAEYWLIDPLRETVDLYRLGRDGRYVSVAAHPTDRMESVVLNGFWVDPGWLWSEPIPKLNRVLKAWGLI